MGSRIVTSRVSRLCRVIQDSVYRIQEVAG